MNAPTQSFSQAEAARAGREVLWAAAAAGALGAFSTLADWVWAHYLRDGALLPALVHGVLIFALLALVLGRAAAPRDATFRLLWTLPLAGLALAGAFYPIARLVGYLGALLVTWVAMWLSLATLQGWAQRSGEGLSGAVARGLLAAVGSGLAFWAVSGMWTDPAFTGGYPTRLAYWTFAFLPGFVALLLRRIPRPPS